MPRTITLRVARYQPDHDTEPTMREYEIPFRSDWAVLDGLNHIKDHIDGTLSYRWSCRMGICGSCGMTVDGDPRLSCASFLTDYAPGPVTVEPLRNFPVVRDLVVDIGDFMAKLPTVQPWLVADPPDEGEHRQTPEEMEEYQRYSMCINCMLCYSACPVYGLDDDFLGPAAIALAQRYNLDSRDQGAHQRVDVLAAADGVWSCTFVGECTTACPKGVDPAGAIQRYKLTAATSLLMPWSRR